MRRHCSTNVLDTGGVLELWDDHSRYLRGGCGGHVVREVWGVYCIHSNKELHRPVVF